MSHLIRAKRQDLLQLAEELSLDVDPKFTVSQLYKLITGCPGYDEHFTRELLIAIKEEREEKEMEEKEEREKEREREEREKERKERLEKEERERERKERLEREEREKERKERLEREERDRDERERERIRAFELQKLELEVMSKKASNGENMQLPELPLKIRIRDVMSCFNPKEDDISLFLVLFERQAKVLNIPAENHVTQLISLLPPDIVQLIAREPEEEATKYEYVKNLLLQRFKMSAERFRQLFNKHQKSSESTWYDFYYELKNYLEGWLDGLNIKTFDQLKDLMLVDQIKKRTSTDFKEHIMDEWTTIISPNEIVKKIEDFEDVRKTIKPKFATNQDEELSKGSFKPHYENSRKKVESTPPHYKHFDKWNDYRYQNGSYQRQDARQRNRYNYTNQENSYDKRYRPRCFECGSFEHFKAQCPQLKPMEEVNCMHLPGDSFENRTFKGFVNGFKTPILRDTGSTVDVISHDFVEYEKLTGDYVWVKCLIDDQTVRLPLAEVDINCELGHVKTTAAVISHDPGKYILGNRTAQLFKEKPGSEFKKAEKMWGSRRGAYQNEVKVQKKTTEGPKTEIKQFQQSVTDMKSNLSTRNEDTKQINTNFKVEEINKYLEKGNGDQATKSDEIGKCRIQVYKPEELISKEKEMKKLTEENNHKNVENKQLCKETPKTKKYSFHEKNIKEEDCALGEKQKARNQENAGALGLTPWPD